MVAEVGALGKHLALIGFMGAGKTTIGREVARLTERPFVDTDDEIERRSGPIPQIFEEHGEAEFRRLEEEVVAETLDAHDPAVVALGGGAVLAEPTRARLRRRAFTVHVVVDPATAWARTAGSQRPLARDEESFRRLFAERERLYDEVGDADGETLEEVLSQTLRVSVRRDALPAALDAASGGAVVADERLPGLPWWPGPWPSGVATLVVPSGEPAKTVDAVSRLWDELAIGRDGTLVAIGGGSTLDVAGFAAATYLRGIEWVAVPTTLVAQVDAAIGGKTGVDLGKGKNLVGAFHLPREVIVDPDALATLPDTERREGMAEVVKTGLLAGRPLWELEEEEMVRACAAFKCAVVLSDPYERGRRAILNLGHTFGHALEAASDYRVRHGEAVALGLLAALRLSGRPTDVVEDVLAPRPVRVDRERAWAALKRDKKAKSGRTQLVLLEAAGSPVYGVELPDADVRAALDALIVD